MYKKVTNYVFGAAFLLHAASLFTADQNNDLNKRLITNHTDVSVCISTNNSTFYIDAGEERLVEQGYSIGLACHNATGNLTSASVGARNVGPLHLCFNHRGELQTTWAITITKGTTSD